jgi:predicted membrane protein
MRYHKTLDFIQEIGTIMYVGGILSHIVIGIIFKDADVEAIHNVYVYKEQSAYILILPGLALKVISDILLYISFKMKPNWLKIKFIAVAFLTINAFVFLVPMMPELVALAKESIPTGSISESFLEKEHKEQFIGQLNILPLIVELVLGSFKPNLSLKKSR